MFFEFVREQRIQSNTKMKMKMKKGLLYLCMFVMGSLAFTACNDDDPNWQKIPDEISSQNANLKINGATTSGSVSIDMKSETAAVLKLNNVIPGCDTVSMDVEMAEQPDGSFNFKGSKTVEGIEVRSENTTGKIQYEVSVEGNVTQEGTLTADMDINVVPSSLNGHIYTNATLRLSYSGRGLVGKQISLQITDGQTANLTLSGIIPGEPQAVLEGVALTANGFKCDLTGTATTAGGASVQYTGSILNDTLTLALETTLSAAAQGDLAGTWDMYHDIIYKENIDEGLQNAPFLFKWVSPYFNPAMGEQINPAHQISTLASVMVSHIIGDVLHNVNFSKDGNVTAQYFPTEMFSGDKDMLEIVFGLMGDHIVIPEGRVWQDSPKNLAFWYTKDNKLYIIPDIPMILKQVAEDGGNVDFGGLDINDILKNLQNMSGEQIKASLQLILDGFEIPLNLSGVDASLLEEIVKWLTTGIPLNYTITNNELYVYVDKDMVAPFMAILLPMLPAVDEKLAELATQPGGELIGMLPFMTGVLKLQELSEAWEKTTLFNLGLEFEK